MAAPDKLIDTRVRDVLRTKGTFEQDADVLTAPPSATVYHCIEQMAENDFGSIVIVEGEAIVGIFTERDYMKNIALKGRSSDETEVREVMTGDVATVDAEKPLEACLDLMTDLGCRHLPVVDEEGALDDIISVRDCMRQISEAAKSEALQLRNYVTGQYPV
jgi:CBS domain-containing protein